MTEREKIINIIRQSGYGYFITHDNADTEQALQDTAKALIENEIGDILEYKARAKVAERNDKIKERALTMACIDKARTYCPNKDEKFIAIIFKDEYLREAEKEIEEDRKMKDYKRLTETSIGCFKYILKDHKPKAGEFNDYDAFFNYSTAVKRLGELEDKIERGEIDYIADKDKEIARLTEENERLRAEKTCRNLSENNPVDEFICSKCGFMTEEFGRLKIDEDDGEHYHYEYEIKYCPNCGAKVEEEQ